MDIIFVLKIFKAMVEVAGFALLGQGILALFAGNTRDQNFVYVVFKIITRPATAFARLISPRFILDKHIPFVAFAIVILVWSALVIAIVTQRLSA